MAGATLTATSVGITARVLSDLGRLHDPEGQIILGAAVIDDILGLLILTVVAELAEGRDVSLGSIMLDDGGRARLSAGDGRWSASSSFPRFFAGRPDRPARHADRHGLDHRVRAGLAGRAVRFGDDHRRVRGRLLVRGGSASPRDRARNHRDRPLLRALFFVAVGASVDLSALDPLKPASRFALLIGGVLILVGVAGKLLGRLCPFLVPRQQDRDRRRHGPPRRGRADLRPDGLASGVFDAGLFGGVTLMVMVTTLLAPSASNSCSASLATQPGCPFKPIDDLVETA